MIEDWNPVDVRAYVAYPDKVAYMEYGRDYAFFLAQESLLSTTLFPTCVQRVLTALDSGRTKPLHEYADLSVEASLLGDVGMMLQHLIPDLTRTVGIGVERHEGYGATFESYGFGCGEVCVSYTFSTSSYPGMPSAGVRVELQAIDTAHSSIHKKQGIYSALLGALSFAFLNRYYCYGREEVLGFYKCRTLEDISQVLNELKDSVR